MKKIFIISFMLFSLICGREVFHDTKDAISIKSSNNGTVMMQTQTNTNTSSREDIVLFEWNFEDEQWNNDAGWFWTEDDYHSETHSYLSPNDDGTLNNSWNLVSDAVSLPILGDGEIMRFKFWLFGDTPDTDGDGDNYLEDYYQLSIMDLNALAWHASHDAPDSDGASYWCADETVGSSGGYLDEWMQYLDSPSISLFGGESLTADIKFEIEDEAGGAVAGSCTDGWDAANVRISTDGGATWDLLEDPNNPYDFECGYGWIYNNGEYEEGGSLNHLAPGWGGSSGGWINFEADLSAYDGNEVIIRFAFGSDPAWSTPDQDDMTGFQVDKIHVGDQYADDADGTPDNNTMIPSGEVWEGQFYDYCDETRPGGNGWEEYVPGLAFNGNTTHDISHFAGKDVLIKFSSRYDDNHDGGQGVGIFIDDFSIYKESSGGYPAPTNLSAESGNESVSLSWDNMNASGDHVDFAYDNDDFNQGIRMVDDDAVGLAGTSFELASTSTVHSVDIYHLSFDDDEEMVDFDMEICAYGTFGSLYDTEELYDCLVVNTAGFEDGWNTVDVPEWSMDGSYIIAHTFNSTYAAALDESADGSHSYFSYRQSNGDTSGWQSDIGFEGAWGTRANISFDSPNVSYNVYRDDAMIATDQQNSDYFDDGLINDVVYTYAVTAVYADGEESDYSNTVDARPESDAVHEEGYDDGTAEEGYNAGYNGFCAVRFEAADAGEDVKRFKWFQQSDGGAFYIKFWNDDNGQPGDEIESIIQISGNMDGWNEKEVEDLVVSGTFWAGAREFTSTRPFGLDTDSDAGNSMSMPSGEDWGALDGNLMIRVVLEGDDDPCADTVVGDVNGDGGLNVLDVVALVNAILGGSELEGCDAIAADLNGDGTINILDVVSLVNSILGNARVSDATSAEVIRIDSGVSVSADGYVGAVQMTLSHDSDFVLHLTDAAYLSEYRTVDNQTTLIVLVPEGEEIFTSTGSFEIEEILVTNSKDFIDTDQMAVTEFSLGHAYPNPFNPTTTVSLSVPEAGHVSVKVYNLMGQVVGVLMDGMVQSDIYSLTFDGTDLSSGVYMIKAETGSQITTQKIMMVK